MTNIIRKHLAKLKGYTPGFQPKTNTAIKINTNENPYPPSPKIAKALKNFSIDKLKKYPQNTSQKLRKFIASLYGFAPSNIIIGNGSDEILTMIIRSFLEEKDTLSYFYPSYSLYQILSKIHNCKYKEIPLKKDFSLPPINLILKELNQVKALFITSPNAPSGRLFEKKKLIQICQQFHGLIVIDEAYADFSEENCLDLIPQFPNLIITRTLSKSYSLAAIRLGFAISSPNFIQIMDKVRDSYNINSISQTLALIALQDQKYFNQLKNKIIATRERTSNQLKKMKFSVIPSQTNFIFVQPPQKISAQQLTEKLAKKKIFIRYFNDEAIKNLCRISIGTDDEMNQVLKEIKTILN